MLRRLLAGRPLVTSALTGFGVMALGDAGVQVAADEDVSRVLVTSTWNGAVSPGFYVWYKFIDTVYANAPLSQFAKKLFVNQLVLTSLNTPCFMLCARTLRPRSTGSWRAPVGARARGDGRAVRARGARAHRLVVGDVGPGERDPVPLRAGGGHLKIAYRSYHLVLWGAYISFVAHRRPETPGPPCSEPGSCES